MSKISGNLAKNFSRLCDLKASFHRRRRKIFTCQQSGTVAFYKHPFLLGSPAKALVPAFTDCQKPISHANSLQGWRITHNVKALAMWPEFMASSARLPMPGKGKMFQLTINAQ
jgi:hypothetical protein